MRVHSLSTICESVSSPIGRSTARAAATATPQTGLSTAQKWASLSSGIETSGPVIGNYSMAAGTGPFTIAPGESITVGFAFLGGDDLPDLQHNVALAKSAWNGEPAPATAVLSPPLGNPVLNGDARWTLVVPDVPSRVKAGVYNVRGQLVRDLSGVRLFPGAKVLLWDRPDDRGERAAPGVYFLHVDLGTQVRREQGRAPGMTFCLEHTVRVQARVLHAGCA